MGDQLASQQARSIFYLVRVQKTGETRRPYKAIYWRTTRAGWQPMFEPLCPDGLIDAITAALLDNARISMLFGENTIACICVQVERPQRKKEITQ